MSWSIGIIENSVTVPEAAQADLIALESEHDFSYDDRGAVDGELLFNPDDMEWMDYLGDDQIVQVLVSHGAQGRVLFGSLEGDDAGSYWGYEFQEGKCVRLKMVPQWVPV